MLERVNSFKHEAHTISKLENKNDKKHWMAPKDAVKGRPKEFQKEEKG